MKFTLTIRYLTQYIQKLIISTCSRHIINESVVFKIQSVLHIRGLSRFGLCVIHVSHVTCVTSHVCHTAGRHTASADPLFVIPQTQATDPTFRIFAEFPGQVEAAQRNIKAGSEPGL